MNVQTNTTDNFSTEKAILLKGFILMGSELLLLGLLFIFNPELVRNILLMFVSGLAGGTMTSISMGLAFNFSTFSIISVLSVLYASWLMIYCPLIVIGYKKILNFKVFNSIIQKTEKLAESQKNKVGKYGIVGLFVFVWLPFPWTGSMVGSVLGNLMGFSVKKVLSIVMPAIILSVIAWTIAFERMYALANITGRKAFYAALLVMILSVSLSFYRSNRQKKKEQ